jgi:phage baseplate assembly protein W
VPDFIGSGWAFPVGVDATGQIALVSGSREIEQAMRLILSTYPGERPMRPRFGSKLRDFIFDGATWENAAAIAAEVRAALRQWEPRATVVDVLVIPEAADPGVLMIDILYTIKGTNDPRNLVFPFYTIPAHADEP